jgi:predicted nucleotidyltransferase
MVNQIREILVRICKSLNKYEVDYIIIGGIAVGVQGYPRYTADIDFWYNPTASNFNNILKALDDINVDTTSLKDIIFDPQKTFLRIPNLGIRIEFLPHIPGLESFKEARRNVTNVNFDGVSANVLGFDDLIRNKEAVKRPDDLRDVDELKKRKPG